MSAWRGRCLRPDRGQHVGGHDAEEAQHLLPRQHPAGVELGDNPIQAEFITDLGEALA
jgi:hypothetical protein